MEAAVAEEDITVTDRAAGRDAGIVAAAVAADVGATRIMVQTVIKTKDIIPAADCDKKNHKRRPEPDNG
ncbi:hypothetical protein [Jeotgalibacillus haloalkalitolerans]|uniref:Uncharacterized protein n=1 Tax=Jeotgalibacillus haloalkalitolerans TaxID=3104292 RepID=A0ABU5KHD7_9BACL|nr:hypothetical protein [Jeotgalibacillus sp. HH7-29]MDZ5710661.1 hypothetical protein [Jeotgalibacillus sp. HH7-29]